MCPGSPWRGREVSWPKEAPKASPAGSGPGRGPFFPPLPNSLPPPACFPPTPHWHWAGVQGLRQLAGTWAPGRQAGYIWWCLNADSRAILGWEGRELSGGLPRSWSSAPAGPGSGARPFMEGGKLQLGALGAAPIQVRSRVGGGLYP